MTLRQRMLDDDGEHAAHSGAFDLAGKVFHRRIEAHDTMWGRKQGFAFPSRLLCRWLPAKRQLSQATSRNAPVTLGGYVPGVGGNPGYHLNPSTGARVRP
jgi:hypothetical protein